MLDHPKTVLVLEDEPSTFFVLDQILKRAGYAVLGCSSCDQVLDLSGSTSIDAFLLDVEVTGSISGVDCCRTLRRLQRYEHTPIIVMSGLDEKELLASAFQAGADDFLHKPFLPEAVILRLRSHLQRLDYFHQLQQIRTELSRFVSSRAKRVAEDEAAGRPTAPAEHELAILFTDIREFTALSGRVAPQALFDSLSGHLNKQVELVHEHHGYVDKFSGDGLLAVFDRKECATDACLCALRIRDYAARTKFEHLPEIARTGIGLHFGPAILGTLGTSRYREHSVIGLTVNVAARLCGQAEAMSIAASEAIRLRASDHPLLSFKQQRQVEIRGLEQPMLVYSLEWFDRSQEIP